MKYGAPYLRAIRRWASCPFTAFQSAALHAGKTITLAPDRPVTRRRRRPPRRLEKFRNRWDLLDSLDSCGTAFEPAPSFRRGTLGCAPSPAFVIPNSFSCEETAFDYP